MYAEKTDYDDIEMSSRLRNILRRNGFESLEGLREYPKEHFIKFRNMGQATLQELYQICEEQGIKLRSVEDLNDREHGVIFDDFLCLDAFGIRNKYGYTQNDMAESLDVSYIHYSQIEQGRHRMSLELMLKIVTKYGVDPNTLFGIESREKHENKDLSVLEDKLQMLKPNDREYAMSTCLIFIEGLEARKEVV